MKYTFFKISLLAITIMSLNACTEVVDIDLNEANPQYVIEGNISNDGKPCIVEISKTVNFSDANNYPKVSKAEVILKDDAGNQETLTETKSGIYESKKLLGTIGRTYTLSVKHEGNTFVAISKMPELTDLKGVTFLESSFGGPPGGGKDSLPNFTAVPVYKDLANVKNYYRFIQFVNDEEDKSFLVRNDNLSDGKNNAQPVFSQGVKVVLGAKYRLIMQNIDENTYNYFFSLSQIAGNGPGGGTTPSNPISNISGGALGYFSAHSQSEVIAIVK